MDVTIGEVAHRTGVTERTLRYYEELGLLSPARDSGGRRVYGPAEIDRLYRIRLLRELGTPVAELAPDRTDLLSLTSRHLAGLDRRMAELARQRERVRTVEERLMSGQAPADEELLGVLTALADPETAATRRLTLLVYRDIEAAQRHLVEVFGFGPGELSRDGSGAIVHGEVYAGDGLIWMHREAPEYGLASPATLGGASHCMAVHVDDVEAHCARVREAGGEIVYGPMDMPYGVREYGVRDTEGGLWSFMQPQHPEEER
ncbi:MerR family transcriptional regulator [Streptomyces sp. KLOTTS4A1]|uniref:MerR family transcriptional regulator n=1 Tax=Streptomyces sp. KLOTTS4A1 TaxID=3390996 RepID=UPI0039F4B9FC